MENKIINEEQRILLEKISRCSYLTLSDLNHHEIEVMWELTHCLRLAKRTLTNKFVLTRRGEEVLYITEVRKDKNGTY